MATPAAYHTSRKTTHRTGIGTHVIVEHYTIELQKIALHSLVQHLYRPQGFFSNQYLSTIPIKATKKAGSALALLQFHKGQNEEGREETILMDNLTLHFLPKESVQPRPEDAQLEVKFREGQMESMTLFFSTHKKGFVSHAFQAHFEHHGFSDLLDYAQQTLFREAPRHHFFWITLTVDTEKPKIVFVQSEKHVGDPGKKVRFSDMRQHSFVYDSSEEVFTREGSSVSFEREIYLDSLQSLLGMIPLKDMLQL